MGTLIDESDEIDIEAEWADQVAKSSVTKGKKRAVERCRNNRKRIEALQEERMLHEMIDDYDNDPTYFD
ncbi:MAG: hypothetical protein D6B27_03370 [Gammaproteobacteria bacterium]|nr:MAG: hypothetical protein D6B27_03370 [Gammaproteobacteria bacterium]